MTLFCLLILPLCFAAQDGQITRRAGGPCSYNKYQGEAVFTKVKKIRDSKLERLLYGGQNYQGYEVWFTFKTKEDIKEKWALPMINKAQLFQLVNSWNPGPRFLKKYSIKKGAKFVCDLSIITSGTCSPIIFDFPKIDRADYFESR